MQPEDKILNTDELIQLKKSKPVVPPIYQTSNFFYDNVADFKSAFKDEFSASVYTRGNNPSNMLLCNKLAALEKAEACLVFGSGAAAINATLISFLEKGDHIICVNNCYSWTEKMIVNILGPLGIEYDFVDGCKIKEIKSAKKENTKLLILESPTSMFMELQDIEACGKWAKENNIISTLDNSYTTPLLQNPIELGIDLVTHSISKYIGGHSDVIAGAVMGTKELIEKIFYKGYMTFGSVLSPNDSSLVLRGLRTLPVRLKHIQESTNKVVDFLDSHELVDKIYYPHYKNSPQLALAKKQMKGSSGLLSFTLKLDTPTQAEKIADKLKLFRMAVSWGGFESLVIPLVTFHEREIPDEEQKPWNMYRISIGLERVEELIDDLKQAFDSN